MLVGMNTTEDRLAHLDTQNKWLRAAAADDGLGVGVLIP